MNRRKLAGAAAVAIVAAVLVPTQAVGHGDVTLSRHNAALVAQVNVTAKEFKFVLNKKTAKRGVVTFKITNAGALSHDFKIRGRTSRSIGHGKTTTLRVTFLRKGHYTYVCTVPGHAAAGMKGVFTIN